MKTPAGPKLAAQIVEEYLTRPPADCETEDVIAADRETLGSIPESPVVRQYAPHLRAEPIIQVERVTFSVIAIDAVRLSHPRLGSRLVVTGARAAKADEIRRLGSARATEIPLRASMEAMA